MKPKEVEKIRLFVVKFGNYKRWKTSKIVGEVEKRFGVSLSKRTVQRWRKRHKEGCWDLRDKSKKPHTIRHKITTEIEDWVVEYRKRTGFDAFAIQSVLANKESNISVSSIKRIIAGYGLQKEKSKMKGKRLKYVRWQRLAPNSLWQMDWTEEYDKAIRFVVEDDCSRYCLALEHWPKVSTRKVTALLDKLVAKYGKPRQVLTDNHGVFGGTGGTSNQFDKWCKKRGIEHIRCGVNKPTTLGKVEKLHDTFNKGISRYKNPEHWRHGYNVHRPHRSLHGKTPAQAYSEWFRYLYFKRKWTKTLREKTRHMS